MTIPFPGKKLRSAQGGPPTPRGLGSPERRLWRELVDEFDFTDRASLALLESALRASQRARECQQIIATDGLVVTDRFGQRRQHPLLASERDARAGFHQAWRMLGLDLGRRPSE